MEGAGKGHPNIPQPPKNVHLCHEWWSQTGPWPLDPWHGSAANPSTASSILLHLFAILIKNRFKRTEIKQTHLGFVIFFTGKTKIYKKKAKQGIIGKSYQWMRGPRVFWSLKLSRGVARFFSQHAGKTVPWDRSALSSVGRIGLALLELRVELGMKPGSWLNPGFEMGCGDRSTSRHSLGTAANI